MHNIVGKSVGLAKPLEQFVVVVRAVGTDRVVGGIDFAEPVAYCHGRDLVAVFCKVCG